MIRIFIAHYSSLFIIVLLRDSGGVAVTTSWKDPQEVSAH